VENVGAAGIPSSSWIDVVKKGKKPKPPLSEVKDGKVAEKLTTT